MKKLILLGAFIGISVCSFAQEDTKKDADKKTKYDTDQKIKDDNKSCTLTMKNGKMMMIVDGKTVVMDKEVTLQNGTVVSMDGNLKSTDGKITPIKEGTCIDMSGKMILVKNTQIEKDPKTDTK